MYSLTYSRNVSGEGFESLAVRSYVSQKVRPALHECVAGAAHFPSVTLEGAYTEVLRPAI